MAAHSEKSEICGEIGTSRRKTEITMRKSNLQLSELILFSLALGLATLLLYLGVSPDKATLVTFLAWLLVNGWPER